MGCWAWTPSIYADFPSLVPKYLQTPELYLSIFLLGHRVQSVNKMRAIAIDVARSVVCTCVCLCVWVLVTRINFCLGADSWWPKEPLLDGVEISPRKRAWLFWGLSGPLKTTGSLCCGERSKRDPGDHLIVNIGMQRRDHSTLYNCSTARQSCDAAIYQNSLTTCLLPLLMA